MSSSPVTAEPPPAVASEAREFSLRERVLLWLISWAGYLAISVIGPTLRYSISWEEEPSQPGAIFEKPVIYSFWHRAVFPASWMWRKQRIAVMVSRSFDGEYIAQPGPVGLSKVTSIPMAAFYVALGNSWVLKTWDDFMIPKPFSKALVRLSRKTVVPADADDTQIADYHAELQAALERVTQFAEANVARVGSEKFPIRRH